jgi:hypothetical protein
VVQAFKDRSDLIVRPGKKAGLRRPGGLTSRDGIVYDYLLRHCGIYLPRR